MAKETKPATDWNLYKDFNQIEVALDMVRKQLSEIEIVLTNLSSIASYASRDLAIRLEDGLAERKAAQAE